ncbi:MAG TPA: sigma-70 family RNA polymerase sigma factor [Oligoflexus sp.]|uniref:sigma-70 family RNA polymerase sigma factor n=1 Tax=Oligoflexus sp. TaxID=1971216 RepID=UPI002D7FC999|nr:sigma-70 family RNA polymerase sigma factor [Oligoflexus sp.]HET9236351.1 sigma-70 family RNA polymerase sigma factor [Oligoflexus sp.]
MDKSEWLAKSFQDNRAHLKAVAYRMLGTSEEADDAVQETWLRLSRSDAEQIENLSGWLTTVIARVCLDVLRSRRTRRETPFENPDSDLGSVLPDDASLVADSVGPALLVVLDTLNPAERLAFVLHDLFGLSFEEIAPIVERSVPATRQLASRARRRVRGMRSTALEDCPRQREVVTAFLAASREGRFEDLLNLLAPDIILRADAAAIKITSANQHRGAPAFESEMRDPKTIARTFQGKAAGALLAFIDGFEGATWIQGSKPRVAFAFAIRDGLITEIDVVMDPVQLAKTEIEVI